MIDQFDIARFEKVVEQYGAIRSGLIYGEYQYQIVFKKTGNTSVILHINSSIGSSGFASGTGENSIRVWLTNNKNYPIGNKTQRWITRQKGWEYRLSETLKKVIAMAEAVKFCPKCNKLESVFITKKEGINKGRFFKKCDCERSFHWLDEYEQ